jgi:hypothetical protein
MGINITTQWVSGVAEKKERKKEKPNQQKTNGIPNANHNS